MVVCLCVATSPGWHPPSPNVSWDWPQAPHDTLRVSNLDNGWMDGPTADDKQIQDMSLWNNSAQWRRLMAPEGAADHTLKPVPSWRLCRERLNGHWQGCSLSARHYQPSLTRALLSRAKRPCNILSVRVPARCSQPRQAVETQHVVFNIWSKAAVCCTNLKANANYTDNM